MKTMTRAVLTAALVASVAAGTALPADAATRTPSASHSAHVVSTARTALPEPTVDRTVPTPRAFTVHASQRTACAGTAKCVLFSGTAVPGQTIVVRYDLAPGAKRRDIFASGPATALIATADAKGNWSATAEIYSPLASPDPRSATGRSVRYHAIMSEDITTFTKTGQYLGYIPVK